MVNNDGTIYYVPPVTYRTFCKAGSDAESESNGPESWRWHTRNCTLMLGSWTYRMDEVDILPGNAKLKHDIVDLSFFMNDRVGDLP